MVFFICRIFTISFRSFSPLPDSLEYHPGQSYYFISTASQGDIHRMVGGYCTRNHMKIVFKVMDTETYQELYPANHSPPPSHSVQHSRTAVSLPQMERMVTTPRTVVDSGGESMGCHLPAIVLLLTLL